MTPSYLREKLLPLRRFLYGDNNPLTYRDIFCNTQRYMNSFFPDAVRIWNNIDHNFKSCNSILSFKKHINALIRPNKKSIFNIIDPLGLKYIFQLRLRLSPLKHHKYNYNFIDTPVDTCDCGAASENITHFLFHCPRFAHQRFSLIDSITMILLPYPEIELENNYNLLLYGNHNLLSDENRQILILTIKYIKDILRFGT